MTLEVDLNCDLGEGCALDGALMPLITSANVACGFHAGDPSVARATLEAAKRHAVQVGAHPGFPDRENFGRTELKRSEPQIYDDCVYQIGALMGLARAVGCEVCYVKPHGALYNMACRDDAYARPIIAAAELFGLPIMVMPGSRMEALCQHRCVTEGFADRRYLPDGFLVPRTQANAFIEDPLEAVHQVEWLIRDRGVRTICVHGDNPKALGFVQELRGALEKQGMRIVRF